MFNIYWASFKCFANAKINVISLLDANLKLILNISLINDLRLQILDMLINLRLNDA